MQLILLPWNSKTILKVLLFQLYLECYKALMLKTPSKDFTMSMIYYSRSIYVVHPPSKSLCKCVKTFENQTQTQICYMKLTGKDHSTACYPHESAVNLPTIISTSQKQIHPNWVLSSSLFTFCLYNISLPFISWQAYVLNLKCDLLWLFNLLC